MPTNYKLSVTRKIKDELYTTDQDVEGPANLDDFIASLGAQGTFELAIREWKRQKSVELSGALKNAVEPGAQGSRAARRAQAKRIEI